MGQKQTSNGTSTSKEQEIIDDKISKQLNEEKEKEEKEIKILFFGMRHVVMITRVIFFIGLPGSGGTIVMHKIKEYMEEKKQKLNGLSSSATNASFKEIIHFHSLRSIQQIIHASKILDIPLFGQRDKNKEKLQLKVDELGALHFTFHQTAITPELGFTIKAVWALKVCVNVSVVNFFARAPSKSLTSKQMKRFPTLRMSNMPNTFWTILNE